MHGAGRAAAHKMEGGKSEGMRKVSRGTALPYPCQWGLHTLIPYLTRGSPATSSVTCHSPGPHSGTLT